MPPTGKRRLTAVLFITIDVDVAAVVARHDEDYLPAKAARALEKPDHPVAEK